MAPKTSRLARHDSHLTGIVFYKDAENRPIADLDISSRVQKYLAKEGVSTVGELLPYTENRLLGLEGFGQKSLEEVRSALAALGFDARPDELEGWLQREIADKLQFRRWLFGHMHADWAAPQRYTCLFNRIVELNGGDAPVQSARQGEASFRPRHESPHGATLAELARFVDCSLEDAKQAAAIGFKGCTCAIDPDTREHLFYDADFRRFLMALGMSKRTA